MDLENKMKQAMKKNEISSIIMGVVLCVILGVLLTILIMDRVREVEQGETETKVWLNFGIVVLIVSLVIIFVKYIVLVCMDSKKPDEEKYERINIVVIRVRKWLNLRGYWEYSVVVENIDTKEQFTIDGVKDLEEDKTYYMLRAKHSKLFVYEPFEIDIPRE